MRPPNLPTAAADIFAGAAICGYFNFLSHLNWDSTDLYPLFGLVLASVLLYAGGVVFNDVFDARLDAIERPERPIPSGIVPLPQAVALGILLLAGGLLCAFWVGSGSGWLSVALTGSILFYDGVAKKVEVLGPLAMGVCRSLNLWLGMSLLPVDSPWPYLWVPLVYIFAVTQVSRGEVKGGNHRALIFAGLLYAIVIFGVGMLVERETPGFWAALPFLALFGWMVFKPLSAAYRDPVPGRVRKAVKAGVLGIVVLDAAWTAGYAHWTLGLLVLSLWPLSMVLARKFAVT